MVRVDIYKATKNPTFDKAMQRRASWMSSLPRDAEMPHSMDKLLGNSHHQSHLQLQQSQLMQQPQHLSQQHLSTHMSSSQGCVGNNSANRSTLGNNNCDSADSYQFPMIDFQSGPSSLSYSKLVRINVGGVIFLTSRDTLDGLPDTRLSCLQESDPNYNQAAGEWFFDRNCFLFNFVLDFYRTGELHLPHNVCGPSIRRELNYWQINESYIAPCCWNRYREFDQEKKIFEHIERAFESKTLDEAMAETAADLSTRTRWQIWRRRIYLILEEPMSSKIAKTWTLAFLLMVLCSIGILCIETLPGVRLNKCVDKVNWTSATSADMSSESFSPYTAPTICNPGSQSCHSTVNQSSYTSRGGGKSTTGQCCDGKCGDKSGNRKMQLILYTNPHPILEYIDSTCTSFFTLEFLVRFVVAPDRLKFLKSPMNIIDVLCVLPMWIRYAMILNKVEIDHNLLPVYFIITTLRVLRICRVLRLARHYTGVKILLLALKASLRELAMLLIFVFIVVMIFAVLIYYAEFFIADNFDSIPEGYWWAIITLTTVGYGDISPKSVVGYFVGALCALTGILATGLPVPIIANNFNLYYSHAQLKESVMNRLHVTPKKTARHQSPHHIEYCDKDDSQQEDNLALKEASV